MKRGIKLMIVLMLLMLISPVCEAKIVINKQPKSQYSRISGEVTFTVEATGKNLKYQWYVSKDKRKTWHQIKYQTSKSIIIRCEKSNRGYYYRCRILDASDRYKTTKPVRVYVTDIGKKYSYLIDKKRTKNLFYPKAADGYCYVYCHDRTYEQQVIDAINIINKKIGTTFIYTKTGCIADIIIFNFYDYYVEDNIWFRELERYYIYMEGYDLAGITFNDEGIHYLVGLNSSYFDYIMDDAIRGVIIHELGHCIGVEHSNNRNDIMYYISSFNDKMSKNDIKMFKKQRVKIRNIGSVNVVSKKSGITDSIRKRRLDNYQNQIRGK